MKIILAGDWLYDIYEKAFSDAFERLGHVLVPFKFSNYFKSNNNLGSLFLKAQNKYAFGPAICQLNKDFYKFCTKQRADLVFIYRGKFVYASTIDDIKKSGSVVFGYNNDDPFSRKYPRYFWRHFLKAINSYNHVFAYRQNNLEAYAAAGCRGASLLRSYYIKSKNFLIPQAKISANKYFCDVLFAGHYEADGREEYVFDLLKYDINFKLFGTGWEKSKIYGQILEKLGQIERLDDDYNLAINSAKIAVVFLSKINNDTYTRRCFEITATGRFMLSEYSEDLEDLFSPGKEAVYFRNKKEFLEKIKYYLEHSEEREKIAAAGRQKVLSAGHEVDDRIKKIMSVYEKYQHENTSHNS